METIEIVKNNAVITDYYNNEDLTEKEMMELVTKMAKNRETEHCWKKLKIESVEMKEWYEANIWDHMIINIEATYVGECGMNLRPNDKTHKCSFIYEIRFFGGEIDLIEEKFLWGRENETMWGRARTITEYRPENNGEWNKKRTW